MSKDAREVRYAEVEREHNGTRVQVVLDLDGGTRRDISTGIGFFDLWLKCFATCANVDLGVSAEGNSARGTYFLIENVGYCIGRAVREASIEAGPTARQGSSFGVMEEALILAVLEQSGKGWLSLDLDLSGAAGDLQLVDLQEFLRALSHQSGLTIHAKTMSASANPTQVALALAKALGTAFGSAYERADRPVKNPFDN